MNYKKANHFTRIGNINYIPMSAKNAYSELISKANLSGSMALVNLVTEQHLGGVPPFYYKRTITVSAHVVEFTD